IVLISSLVFFSCRTFFIMSRRCRLYRHSFPTRRSSDLGGLETAIRIARDRGGLPPSAPVRHFPQLGPLERLIPAESSEDRTAQAQLRLSGWGPLAELSARLGLPAAGPLVMPGTWEIR